MISELTCSYFLIIASWVIDIKTVFIFEENYGGWIMNFKIKPLNDEITPKLQQIVDLKTKPPGSLGKLESLAVQIGRIQNTLEPALKSPSMLVFAADHGIATEGVSAFPQEVTYQMVLNFLNHGAGINVFCRQHGIDIKIVDAGVAADFPPHPDLIDVKIGKGTKNYHKQPAMTQDECEEAVSRGAMVATEHTAKDCNIIGFGEMGIGNTSSSAVLMNRFCGISIDQCVGRGTGLDDKGLDEKIRILKEATENVAADGTALSVLSAFGGFEIAMMCGAMLKSAELGRILMIDGFIATSAILTASRFNSTVLDYCIFTHKSHEQGHRLLLDYLGADPILDLGMRLGEGTGAAVAYPIIESAVKFFNEMASFESANVSQKM
jgi:nicotinate-nucleotide--dimethylbenzimidazole phosphoribosyltransferase